MGTGLYLVAAAAVVGIGVYGLLAAPHILRKVLALNLIASGVFLLLVVLGGGHAGRPDPVPQAMVLTGIVVTISATAFALILLVRLHRDTGQVTLEAPEEDDH